MIFFVSLPKPKQTNMKQFAFPLSVKCSSIEERDECLNLLESIGYENAGDFEETARRVITNYGKFSLLATAHPDDALNYDNNRHHIDHFNPKLIRDIAAACTNDAWQEGELWVSSRGELSRLAGYAGFKVNPNGHRRPTIAEICAHHGYEIKGRDIVKKVETVSNCDKSYCETARQLDEAKAEIKRLEERLIPVNQMSACVEQVGNAMKLMKDLKEASQKTKIETLDHELSRLRSENAELKELMRKRPTVFDSSSVSGGYLITFENKEDNCIEIAFCGKGKFEKVLKALHD
jgi:hypothetical protein